MTNVSNAERNLILEQMLSTEGGRKKLAASMTQPLRLRRDYHSVGRKTFLVEELPDGALPIYDKDPDVAAYVVGDEGQSIVSVTKSRRVLFPLFEITSLPQIPISQIRERRFDLITRAQELGKAEIQAAEDTRVFSVMNAIAVNGYDSLQGQTNADIPVLAPLNGAVLADAYALVERHDLRVARVFLNAVDYADIRKFGRDILDVQSQRDLLVSGIQASLWGAPLITSRLVPQGTVYVCCEPEHFGRIPVRSELTVISADNPEKRVIGFSMFENIGIGAFNPKGLARLTVVR